MAYYPCPIHGCDNYFYYRERLTEHMRDVHGINQQLPEQEGRGWYENKVAKPDGTSKAWLHEIAQLKSQLKDTQREPIPVSLPIPSPPKPSLSPISPWVQGADGSFIIESVINQKINPYTTTVDLIKGRLTSHKGEITLHHYEKNTSEIVALTEKAKLLEDKAQGYTYSDTAFLSIIQQIQETNARLKQLTEQTPSDEEITVILERYFRGDINSEDCDKFKVDFMKASLQEIDRLSGNLMRDKELEEVNKFKKP